MNETASVTVIVPYSGIGNSLGVRPGNRSEIGL
jgi:hypothetical protein